MCSPFSSDIKRIIDFTHVYHKQLICDVRQERLQGGLEDTASPQARTVFIKKIHY
jgi:hypothetical protein